MKRYAHTERENTQTREEKNNSTSLIAVAAAGSSAVAYSVRLLTIHVQKCISYAHGPTASPFVYVHCTSGSVHFYRISEHFFLFEYSQTFSSFHSLPLFILCILRFMVTVEVFGYDSSQRRHRRITRNLYCNGRFFPLLPFAFKMVYFCFSVA